MVVTGAMARDDFRALTSDPAAFRDWYDAAMPRVYAYLYSRTGGDAALAEELTQQTFEAAVRHPEGYAGRAETVTWLIGIARHKLVDHVRRAQRDRRHLRVVDDARAHEGPVDAAWTASLRHDIGSALDSLPPDQRLALVLHVVDGLTIRGVAGEMGRSEDATESLIRRAREAFRRAYGGLNDV
jgi:RNA polymerase sigma-70 factor (ECF subfamily)